MGTVFTLLLILHIISGAGALLLGVALSLSKKGNARHKKLGRIFSFLMLSTAVTSLGLAVIHPSIFLCAIGIYTGYQVLQGYTAFRTLRKKWHYELIGAGGVCVAGIILLLVSITGYSLLAGGFGLLLSITSVSDITYVWRKRGSEPTRTTKTIRHITQMGACIIATWTAFLSVNAPYDWSYVAWTLPTIVGSVVITLAARKYTKPRIQ